MAATRLSSQPETHRPSVGLVASELEDQYSESEPFQVSNFGITHSQRTTYKALAVDNALLSASVPFDFSELRQQRFSGLASLDGEHPLRSMRAETSAAAACDNAPRAKRRRHQGRTNSIGATSCFQQLVGPMCTATTLTAAAPASSAAATGAGEQAALPEGTVLLRVAFYRQHIHVRTVEVHSGHTLSDLISATVVMLVACGVVSRNISCTCATHGPAVVIMISRTQLMLPRLSASSFIRSSRLQSVGTTTVVKPPVKYA